MPRESGDVEPPPQFVPASDRALLVRFAEPAEAAGERVRALAAALDTSAVAGLVDFQPAYASLLLRFDPLVIDFVALEKVVRARLANAASAPARPSREVEIPVAYGGEHGADLAAVAAHCGLTEAEFVAAHSGAAYRVEFFGFVAGFGYLSGLPGALATPRLAEPRSSVPAGSVAIGGGQCAIYPAATPGGWRLVGRTPLRPARFSSTPWTLFEPGDRLRFLPIPPHEFARLSEWR